MKFTCEDLGLTREELTERVVNSIAESLLATRVPDKDEGYPQLFMEMIEDRIDSTLRGIAEKLTDEVVDQIVGELKSRRFKMTDRFGEPVDDKEVSFHEIVLQRVEDYLMEEVDADGRTRKECSFSWKAAYPRIVYLALVSAQEDLIQDIRADFKKIRRQLTKAISGTIKENVEEIVSKITVVKERG